MMLIPGQLVALVFRYREIQLQKERRLRIKIADDLHDEVGSSLTRIWHQASQAIPVMEQRKPLRAISETSREAIATRSEEHTSELQSLMRISYAVFCLKQKNLTSLHN